MISSIRTIVLALSSAVLVGYLTAPASAASYQITFGASGFSPAPASPSFVLGQLDLSSDPAHDLFGTVKVDFLDGLNLSAIGSASYQYNAATDLLIIGGDKNGAIGVFPGTDDFGFAISNFKTAPTFASFAYTTSGNTEFFESDASRGGVGDVHVAVSATPIPPTLPLLVTALGGLGLVGWRRRRTAV
jgi:hypothetical protein